LPSVPRSDVLLLVALIALTAVAAYHLSLLIQLAPPTARRAVRECPLLAAARAPALGLGAPDRRPGAGGHPAFSRGHQRPGRPSLSHPRPGRRLAAGGDAEARDQDAAVRQRTAGRQARL